MSRVISPMHLEGRQCISQVCAGKASERHRIKLESVKLKSFASLVKSAKVSVQDREVSVRADRNLFARLLVISQSRRMDLRHVLSFPLGPLPLAPQGTLCKTTKAKLLPLLESSTTAEANEPSASSRTAVILDGMAILQSLSSPGPTFGDLAASVLTSILSVHSAVNSARYRVDFVVDTYQAISIKSCERQSRSLSGAVRMRITKCDQRCPRQWHKFMACSANKAELADFLAKEWKNEKYAPKLRGVILYVCYGSACDRLVSEDGHQIHHSRVPELTCTHEEADTRMFVHAKHASSQEGGRAQTVVISSPDTDVAVIGIYQASSIHSYLVWLTGTKERKRYVSLTEVASNLGEEMVRALPGMHAFSGCDTTSCFKGKGKKRAFDLTRENDCHRLAMATLGDSLPCTDESLRQCEAFVCHLYRQPKCSSVN